MVLGIDVSVIKVNIYISKATTILYQPWEANGGVIELVLLSFNIELNIGTPLKKGESGCIYQVHVPPYPSLPMYVVISGCPPPKLLSYGKATLWC